MRIKQVENALLLLHYFSTTGLASTLTEIATHFDWPRSSTFNLLNTLSHHGYLYEPQQRGQFYPTPKLYELANNIMNKAPLPAFFDELTHEVWTKTNETIWIAAKSGLNAVFLKVRESPQKIRYTTQVGTQVPLFATATGQAILSELPHNQVETILDKTTYTSFSDGTPATKAEVLQNMEQSIERGWFFSASSFTPDLGGIAVPLVVDGRVFALAVAGPWFRMQDHCEEIACILHAAVKKIAGANE